MIEVTVSLLPSAVDANKLKGSNAVVIDILRATTTIAQALDSGATSVRACQEIEQAFELQKSLGADQCVLGGERHGVLIEGFQLDNSPFGYTRDVVGGKTVVFTTTNGTRALAAVQSADRVFAGSFSVLGALIKTLKEDGRPVQIVCAGTDGLVTAEDVLFAGAVVDGLTGPQADDESSEPALDAATVERWPAERTDLAQMAARFYRQQGLLADSRLETLRQSVGGKNLIENGFDRDIARAAEIDLFAFVPEWRDGQITI